MSTLEKAIALAAQAHAGQVDKAGEPYILHPLRVMLRLTSPEARMAAVLHDALEDTDITPERLRQEGFSRDVIEAVLAVTKREGETYEDFVRRAAQHPIGRQVKGADLEDNCDLSRLKNPNPKDLARMDKYKKALETLSSLDLCVEPEKSGAAVYQKP